MVSQLASGHRILVGWGVCGGMLPLKIFRPPESDSEAFYNTFSSPIYQLSLYNFCAVS